MKVWECCEAHAEHMNTWSDTFMTLDLLPQCMLGSFPTHLPHFTAITALITAVHALNSPNVAFISK